MIFYVFIWVLIVFFVLFLLKELFRIKKMCVLCATFILTWSILLILYWLGRFDNLILIALLMGLTVLGIFYKWEKKVKKGLVFRLPLLLTLIFLGYYLLTFEVDINSIVLLVFVWIGFGVVYFYRSRAGSGKLFRKIVECCRKW